jgi:methanethiol S-methyltransferase
MVSHGSRFGVNPDGDVRERIKRCWEMWRSMLKAAAVTAVFGAVHSVLASRTVKRATARRFGERNRNGLYRVFYLSQSFVTFGILAAYIRRQPSRELYRVEGPVALLMHAIQAAAFVYATWAARQVGLRRILGLESFLAWLGGGPVPAEPEAQGPALDAEGRRHTLGPFAWSRHPLNFAPLPMFWLWPRMTTSLLAFNTAATIYLIVGSLHEEARLRDAFGEEYDAYLHSGISFYVPVPDRSGFQPTSAVTDLHVLPR